MNVAEKRHSVELSMSVAVDRGSRFLTVAALASCLAAIACVLFVLWSVNRGLDLRQEGMYLLNYTDPNPSLQFEPFLKALPRVVPQEMFHYRLIYIFAILIQSTLLSTGFWTWASRRGIVLSSKSGFVMSWSLAVLGSCLAYTLFPRRSDTTAPYHSC